MVASILLDASKFQTGTPAERLQYSKSLLEQLSKNGFARIRNHGIDSQRVEEAFEWVSFQRNSQDRTRKTTRWKVIGN